MCTVYGVRCTVYSAYTARVLVHVNLYHPFTRFHPCSHPCSFVIRLLVYPPNTLFIPNLPTFHDYFVVSSSSFAVSSFAVSSFAVSVHHQSLRSLRSLRRNFVKDATQTSTDRIKWLNERGFVWSSGPLGMRNEERGVTKDE